MASCFFRIDPAICLGHILHHVANAVTRRLVGPFNPAEDNRFVGLVLNRREKVGRLTPRHIVTLAFNNAKRALFDEKLSALLAWSTKFCFFAVGTAA